jgi:type IV secretion system protein VirB10
MADISIDRGGELGAGDGVPEPAGAASGAKAALWQKIAGIAGATALTGALAGIAIGYETFHRSAAELAASGKEPAKASEHSVDDALGASAAARSNLASALGTPGTPGDLAKTSGPPTDIFGRPIASPAAGFAANPATQSGAGQARPLNPATSMAVAARRSPIMAYASNGYMPGGLSSSAAAQAGTTPPATGSLAASDAASPFGSGLRPQQPTDRNGSTDFSGQLAHSSIETVRATMVANRSFLLSAGTIIPCTLQTAINSTQAGFVSCVINHDVYSEDGRIVLLDKGTKVLGQYSGGLNQGQARLFILWTRALSPRGVAIDLGSPAADALGRSGVAGGVDNQFWARFGAALMMSVLEDLSNVAGRAVASAGSNTTQVPSQLGQTVLQSTINIRPILRKNQGDTAAIFVAKDFDFSSVYEVGLRR